MARTALVLGGGIGGIVVERERNHVFAPALLWYMTGGSGPDNFTRPLVAMSAKGTSYSLMRHTS